MFTNVGSKIKGLAEFIFVVTVIISLVPAVLVYKILSNDSGLFALLIAAIIIAVGFILGWLSSICLYGYGQLIEDTSSIRKELVKALKEEDKEKRV